MTSERTKENRAKLQRERKRSEQRLAERVENRLAWFLAVSVAVLITAYVVYLVYLQNDVVSEPLAQYVGLYALCCAVVVFFYWRRLRSPVPWITVAVVCGVAVLAYQLNEPARGRLTVLVCALAAGASATGMVLTQKRR
jgi:drug/metabolite transporter (DMT)-like permease